MSYEYDVLIVGAGPAGCTAAFQLQQQGLKIAVLEKYSFPRDKICGDCLSPDIFNQFQLMDAQLANEFLKLPSKQDARGVRIFAPNSKFTDIQFHKSRTSQAKAFVSKRMDFDNFYFNQIKDLPGIDVFENHQVLKINPIENGVFLETKEGNFQAKIVLGADGANSVVSRQLSEIKMDKDHHCAGVRQYFEGVEGVEHLNIELHFYKDLFPGYFWIFSLPNNQVNVGLGMLSNEVSQRKINLKETLSEVVKNHPIISKRFKNAKALDSVQGFGLPLGSRKVNCSGDNFLLLGDAAHLIDPFSGEGIGNAIRSGRIAADHLAKAFKEERFDAEFNKRFDAEIYNRMWTELRVGRFLQKALKFPSLFNFVVNKANKNESFQTILTSMLNDVDLKMELKKPSFYFKLLFG